MRQIKFYELASGKKPVEDFLDSLNDKELQKVIWVLQLIKEAPILRQLPTVYFKPLIGTNGIDEIRIKLGNNQFRILCFEVDNELILATNGFRKKDEKVPKKEIKLAEQRKQEYLSNG